MFQKFVSTTIIPTKLSYPEFDTWIGCASFVSDHIKYEEIAEEKVTSLVSHFYPNQSSVSTFKLLKISKQNF